MQLFLLRHAEAEATSPDSERRLTRHGKQTLSQLCATVSAHALANLTHIWHSPYARAVETAKQVQAGLGLNIALEARSGLTPEDPPLNLIPQLNQQGGDLLIVGHNPHLGLLANALLCGDTWAQLLRMKKAGLLCLERTGQPHDNRPAGTWILNWYITPRSVRESVTVQ